MRCWSRTRFRSWRWRSNSSSRRVALSLPAPALPAQPGACPLIHGIEPPRRRSHKSVAWRYRFHSDASHGLPNAALVVGGQIGRLFWRLLSAIWLVGVRGFEPPAPASRTQCSTRLSYTPAKARRIAVWARHRKAGQCRECRGRDAGRSARRPSRSPPRRAGRACRAGMGNRWRGYRRLLPAAGMLRKYILQYRGWWSVGGIDGAIKITAEAKYSIYGTETTCLADLCENFVSPATGPMRGR